MFFLKHTAARLACAACAAGLLAKRVSAARASYADVNGETCAQRKVPNSQVLNPQHTAASKECTVFERLVYRTVFERMSLHNDRVHPASVFRRDFVILTKKGIAKSDPTAIAKRDQMGPRGEYGIRLIIRQVLHSRPVNSLGTLVNDSIQTESLFLSLPCP